MRDNYGVERSYLAVGGAVLVAGIILWKVPEGVAPPGIPRVSPPVIAAKLSRPGVSSFEDVRPPSPVPQPSLLTVYVVGDVAHPGVYTLANGARAQAALRAAGGALPSADVIAINQARRLRDGEELVVPREGEPVRISQADTGDAARPSPRRRSTRAHARRRSRKPRPESSENVAASVDINRASADDLAGLPGLGESLAERIVAFRAENGPFSNADELLDVAGVTEQRVARFEPYLTFGAAASRAATAAK